MEKGDPQTFVYGDKQETYRLELLAIHRDARVRDSRRPAE